MATNGDLDKDLETFLADERFTRTFDRPADPAKGHAEAVRISYADFGYRDQKNPDLENVFLFFGPLLASRMLFVAKDSLAKEHRVRLIVLDRPGFGETPDVRPEKRLLSCRGECAITLCLFVPMGLGLATNKCWNRGYSSAAATPTNSLCLSGGAKRRHHICLGFSTSLSPNTASRTSLSCHWGTMGSSFTLWSLVHGDCSVPSRDTA